MFYRNLLVTQIVLTDMHFLIYLTLKDVFEITNPASLTTLKIILVISAILFLTASLLAYRHHSRFSRIFYVVAATWYGFILYFLVAFGFYWLSVFIFEGIIPDSIIEFWGKLFFALAIAVGAFSLIKAKQIRTKEIGVKIPNIPSVWKERRVVVISDVHLGQILGVGFAKKVASHIADLKPDILFIVGDLFDGFEMDIEGSLKPFADLKVPLGKYFVSGNHEEVSRNGGECYFDAVEKAGMRILENEKIIIGGMTLIGVNDEDTLRRKKYQKIFSGLSPIESPSILLKHTPLNNDIPENFGVNFQISGHTHGGQIFPYSLLRKIVFRKQNYGLSNYKKMITYTSCGIGTTGPPMRLGTRPEIVLMTFH